VREQLSRQQQRDEAELPLTKGQYISKHNDRGEKTCWIPATTHLTCASEQSPRPGKMTGRGKAQIFAGEIRGKLERGRITGPLLFFG
jgi:hypothetical protein